MQLDLLESKLTKAKRVELMLIDAGFAGVSNIALNHITFRYGSVICNMRKKGHIIETGKTDPYGKVMYYYKGRTI